MPTYNWYRTGTITLTNGTDVVTGLGTTFDSSDVDPGEILVVKANGELQLLEIVQVDNDTQLRIAEPWPHATEGTLEFFVIASITGTHNYELHQKIDQLLNYRSTTWSEVVLWAGGDLFGVPINDKFSNGDFEDGLTDWSVQSASPETTYDVNDGLLTISRNGGSNAPWIEQSFTSVVGNDYVLLLDIESDSTNDWEIEVNGVDVLTGPVRLGKTTVHFQATATTSTVRIKSIGDSYSVLAIDTLQVGDPSGGLYPFLEPENGEFIWVPSPAKMSSDYANSIDSAYDTWLKLGNTGTEQDFINDLRGEAGNTASISVGNVTSVDFGEGSSVTNVGDSLHAIFDFEIERAEEATITVGTVTTGAAGSQVEVTNSGTPLHPIFDFRIPRGELGFGMPPGGVQGQVLKKASGADHDFEWAWQGALGTTLAAYGITDAYTKSESTALFAERNHYHFASDIIGNVGSDAAGRTEATISQPGHGFAKLDCIYHDGVEWKKAQADDINTTAYAVVVDVDGIEFTMALSGRYDVGLHSLDIGEWYYLSDQTAGGLIVARPLTVEQPILFVESLDTVIIYPYRPSSMIAGSAGGVGYHQHSENDIYDLDKYTKAQVDAMITGVDAVVGSTGRQYRYWKITDIKTLSEAPEILRLGEIILETGGKKVQSLASIATNTGWNGGHPTNLLDENNETWCQFNDPSQNNLEITWDFDLTPVRLTGIRQVSAAVAPYQSMNEFKVWASDDNTNWTLVNLFHGLNDVAGGVTSGLYPITWEAEIYDYDGITFEIVDEMPDEPNANTIYFVKAAEEEQDG